MKPKCRIRAGLGPPRVLVSDLNDAVLLGFTALDPGTIDHGANGV